MGSPPVVAAAVAAAGTTNPSVPQDVTWDVDASQASTRRSILADVPDLLARIATGALLLTLAIRLGQNALQTGHITGLLLVASELLVVALTIIRRPAYKVDRSWGARAITTISILGPPLLRPILGEGLLPDLVTAPI